MSSLGIRPRCAAREVPRGARQAAPRRRQRAVRRGRRRVRPLRRGSRTSRRIEREPLTDEVDVLIIGGGFGGLLAGARLREAGIDDIRIIEKGGDFGGTWYWNRYPGRACATSSRTSTCRCSRRSATSRRRSTPTRPRSSPTARRSASTSTSTRDACFQTEVTELRWDDERARWIVSTNRGDAMRARFVVHGQRPAAPAEAARHPRHRARSRATRSTPAAGTTTTPAATPTGTSTGLRGQAGRHHRHRRDRGAVRPAPRRGGRAPLRVPAHAVVDRRARQPPDRSRVGREPRAGLAEAADGQLQQPRLRRLRGRGPRQRRLDRHHRQAAGHAARTGRGEVTAGRRSPATLELADFEKMEQIRARVDAIVDDPDDGRGAEAVLPPVLQAAVLPRRVPRHVQPANVDARRHRRPRRRAHHRDAASSSTASSTSSTA